MTERLMSMAKGLRSSKTAWHIPLRSISYKTGQQRSARYNSALEAGSRMLLAGWFLMAPIVSDKEVKTKGLDNAMVRAITRPLSEWLHDSSYDTAKECEAAKQEKIDFSILNRTKLQAFPGDTKRETMTQVYIQSRCIPSDSILLKSKQ